MHVERENAGNLPALHEHERYAVGEADLLIGILPVEADRFEFVFSCAANDFECIGSVDVVAPIGSETAPRSPGEQGQSLIQNVVAGHERLAAQSLPHGHGSLMVSVVRQMPRQEWTRVNEDHQGQGSP